MNDFLKRLEVRFAEINALRLLRKNITLLLKYREAKVFTIIKIAANNPRMATCFWLV